MADEEQLEQDASVEPEAAPEETPSDQAVEETDATPHDAPAEEELPVAEAEQTAPADAVDGADEDPADEGAPAEGAAEPAAEAPTVAAPAAKKKKKRLPRSERPQRSKPKREKSSERKPIVRLPKPEHARGRRQERQGTVVSSTSDKTIVVRVDLVKLHPRYKKVVRRSTKFHAHDEANVAKVGDLVRIVETRPVSRLKRWRLQEVVREAK
jgi:small subunit ribosomal protein S17